MQVGQLIIAQLLTKIEELNSAIAYLSVNRSYKVLTREGAERKWQAIDLRQKSVILFDIDNLHGHNQKHGYEEMNRRISLVLNCVRSCELLGLVFSGDEFFLVVKEEEAIATCERLRAEMKQYQMTATIAVSPITSMSFQVNYQKLTEYILQSKAMGMRNVLITSKKG
jgi:GGDEF domain-containing protein